MNTNKFSLFALALLLLTARVSFASQTYSVTGVVEDVSPNTVTLRTGAGVLEFNRAHFARHATLHTGDRITVTYTLSARKIKRAPNQQPGRAAPRLDDRAFYFS